MDGSSWLRFGSSQEFVCVAWKHASQITQTKGNTETQGDSVRAGGTAAASICEAAEEEPAQRCGQVPQEAGKRSSSGGGGTTADGDGHVRLLQARRPAFP
eukprot:2689027-Lingulodinium_polyedra.AAC.1